MALVLSYEEREQVDALKAWWRGYGRWIGAAVGAMLLASLSWHGWRWWYGEQQKVAAGLYAALEQAVTARQWEEAQRAWEALAATAWVGKRQASYAALTLAAAADKAQAWQVADQVLAAAIPLAEEEVAALLRRMAAQVRLVRNDPQGALAQLDRYTAVAAFAALIAEVRGDAYAALGEREAAQRAYEEALTAAKDPAWRSLLEAKRDQLLVGGTNPQQGDR